MGLFKKRKDSSLQSGYAQVSASWDESQKRYYNLKDITVMSIGSNCCIAPVDAGYLCEGNVPSMLSLLGNTSRIKQYLPNLDLSTEQNAKRLIEREIVRTESGLGFSYFIMMGQVPIGMIMVNTPDYNEKNIHFSNWTIDFFVFELFEGKGFIKAALPRVLMTLKEKMHVDKVYSIVDASNTRCLNIMNIFPFDEIFQANLRNPQDTNSKVRLFCCNLSTLSFQKR